jgi:molybdopterin synthase sulfur carrier subunit
MVLTIKFIGALRHISNKTQLTIDYEEGMSVRQLLAKILQEPLGLDRTLSDKQPGDSRFNALILVNGREISVLNGLETKLNDGDEIIFVPVVHGG